MALKGLGRFGVVVGVVVVTGIAMAITADLGPGRMSASTFLGMPLVGIGASEPCVLALGGTGILVIGAGIGVVAIGIACGGLLFATGQIAGALIAFAQAGIGIVFFGGQAGVAYTGIGQVVLGVHVHCQASSRGKQFMAELNRELGAILRLRGARTAG